MARATVLKEGKSYEMGDGMFGDVSFDEVMETIALELVDECLEDGMDLSEEETLEMEGILKDGATFGQQIAQALSHFKSSIDTFNALDGKEAYDYAQSVVKQAIRKGTHLVDMTPVYLKFKEMDERIAQGEESKVHTIQKVAVKIVKAVFKFARQTALFSLDVTTISLTCFARIIGNAVHEVGEAGCAIKRSFGDRYAYLKKQK